MEGLQAYNCIMSMNLHFRDAKYNYFRYNGKTKTIAETRLKIRKDYDHLRRLERRYKDDLPDLVLSNILAGNLGWAGDLITPKAELIYKAWKKRKESLKYTIKQDLESIESIGLLTVKEGMHPPLLKAYLAQKINPETMVALDVMFDYIKMWDEKIEDPVVWPQTSLFLKKYKPFVNIEKNDVIKLLKELNH